jgi:RNA polymerase sigma factor (sigma-70 family)
VVPPKYKEYDDAQLIALCTAGDAQAWEALIMRYRRLIYSIPMRFGFQSADAADVFQTVCIKLLEHLRDLKDQTKLSAWLITMTTRQCLLVRSQRSREMARDDEGEDMADPAEDLETVKFQVEEQQTVRNAVARLPQRCRQLIELLYFDVRSPSYDQVSQLMDMPSASIGPTRRRCLEKLRVVLRRQGIK